MDRRDFLHKSAALGLLTAGGSAFAEVFAQAKQTNNSAAAELKMLKPPMAGKINVAFPISDDVVMIDLVGPWEVFLHVHVPGRKDNPFFVYTVAETSAPVRGGGQMKVIPNFTFENAPAPELIVIPAQDGKSQALLEWIRRTSKAADLTMSVCTGAFVLASTGLLSGKAATTHHGEYGELAMKYPDVRVIRGARFVESGDVASAGGLSSGIDLALHIVDRYFGRDVAESTADELEYQGLGWTDPKANSKYAKLPPPQPGKSQCPVCGMTVDITVASSSNYGGKTYYFCSTGHKTTFDEGPDKWIAAE
jgi:YHS domain-containing protein/putative intracellular protease/amidase